MNTITHSVDFSFIKDILNQIIDSIVDQRNENQKFEEFQMEIEKIDGYNTSDTSMSEELIPLEEVLGQDEEEDNTNPQEKFRTKHEENLPSNTLSIDETTEERARRFNYVKCESNELKPVGKIHCILNDTIVIQSSSNIILDLDNILLVKDQVILGIIDDVFGNIKMPHYTISYDKYLKTHGIVVGEEVFLNPKCIKLLLPKQIKELMSKKGCDASNRFDEEILNFEEIEFSDDEKEEEYRHLKNEKKSKQKKKLGNVDNDEFAEKYAKTKNQMKKQKYENKIHNANPNKFAQQPTFPLQQNYLTNYLNVPPQAFNTNPLGMMAPLQFSNPNVMMPNNMGYMPQLSQFQQYPNMQMMNMGMNMNPNAMMFPSPHNLNVSIPSQPQRIPSQLNMQNTNNSFSNNQNNSNVPNATVYFKNMYQ